MEKKKDLKSENYIVQFKKIILHEIIIFIELFSSSSFRKNL